MEDQKNHNYITGDILNSRHNKASLSYDAYYMTAIICAVSASIVISHKLAAILPSLKLLNAKHGAIEKSLMTVREMQDQVYFQTAALTAGVTYAEAWHSQLGRAHKIERATKAQKAWEQTIALTSTEFNEAPGDFMNIDIYTLEPLDETCYSGGAAALTRRLNQGETIQIAPELGNLTIKQIYQLNDKSATALIQKANTAALPNICMNGHRYVKSLSPQASLCVALRFISTCSMLSDKLILGSN